MKNVKGLLIDEKKLEIEFKLILGVNIKPFPIKIMG